MDISIRRSIISGKFTPPPSPAFAHRALFACSLALGQSVVSNFPHTPETISSISACNSFGADILAKDGVADIFGAEELNFPNHIDCGQSNTTLKLLLPIACLSEKQVSLSGSGRLASCNPDPFCAYLSRMGAKAECTSHSLPMRVEGPLKESKLVYFAELGTQFLSGILLCSPFSSEGVEIVIEGELAKWEHVEATLGIMKACGIEIGTIGQDFIWVEPEQAYLPCQLEVPPSSYLSSFPLLAGALCGKVEAKGNLALEKFFSLLQSFGAFAHHSSSSFSASAGALSSSQFYVSDLAEFLPHAIVLASVCQKPSAFHGIAALKPRMKARLGILLSELSKMGVRYENKGNTLEVLGCKLSGANLDPQGDTISALALCTAALCASGPSKMQGADCITRVYPAFFKDMLQLGAIIRHI